MARTPALALAGLGVAHPRCMLVLRVLRYHPLAAGHLSAQVNRIRMVKGTGPRRP